MRIQYNITLENVTTYITYNSDMLKLAMTSGEEITFEYTPKLIQDRNHTTHNILNIDKIEPIILQHALLTKTSDNVSILSSRNITSILCDIVKKISKTHTNYYQYLALFDELVAQYNIEIFGVLSILKLKKNRIFGLKY